MILVNNQEKKWVGGRTDFLGLSFNRKRAFQTCVVQTDYNLLRPTPDMSFYKPVSCFLITDCCITAQWEIKKCLIGIDGKGG